MIEITGTPGTPGRKKLNTLVRTAIQTGMIVQIVDIKGGRSNMSKYILELKHPDSENKMTFKCDTGQEARDYKKNFEKNGFVVTTKREEKKC